MRHIQKSKMGRKLVSANTNATVVGSFLTSLSFKKKQKKKQSGKKNADECCNVSAVAIEATLLALVELVLVQWL